jgi:type IV pilus assembly protein PilV
MKRYSSNEKGFSLLEVLIALVILAIGLLLLGQTQISGIGGNARGQKITTAATLTQDALEGLMNLNYSALPTDEIEHNFDTDFPVYNNGVAGVSKTFMGMNYTRNYTVDIDYPITDTATIMVTVNWVDHAGNPHSVTEMSVRRRRASE